MYIRRLLCPIDFSECSRIALHHAAAIAAWYGAELHALHVTPPESESPPSPSAVEETLSALRDLVSTHALSLSVAATRAAVLTGDPAQQILGYARQAAIDLVVLGTHLTAVANDSRGATVARVWRDAVCQTLLIPQDLRAHAGDASARLAHMLATFDGSPSVLRGGTLALTLT